MSSAAAESSPRAAALYDLGVRTCSRAVHLDDAGQLSEAIPLYSRSIEYFISGYRSDSDEDRRRLVLERARGFMGRAEALKQQVASEGGKSSKRPKTERQAEFERQADANGPSADGDDAVTFQDVVGLKGAKQALYESVVLPMKQPQCFEGARKPFTGLLLFGPPGTGKTLLAKAMATEGGAKFIPVSASDIMNKYVGESEKAVRDLFAAARAKRPCVIFLDEVDSLGRKRSADENPAMRRVKTEILKQMDGIGPSNEGVLVLGATNTPWELDGALRRRFQKRIYTPLPTAAERVEVIQKAIEGEPSTLTRADINRLAAQLEGYSSADISCLVREALMEPIRRCLESRHFKAVRRSGRRYLVPCGPRDWGATATDMWTMNPDELLPPPVDRESFEKALRRTPKTIAAGELERYAEFDAQYGNASIMPAAAAGDQVDVLLPGGRQAGGEEEGEGKQAVGAAAAAAAAAAAPRAAPSSGGFLGWVRNLLGGAPNAPAGPVRMPDANRDAGRVPRERVAVPG